MSSKEVAPDYTESGKKDALASELPDPTNLLLNRVSNWKHVVELLTEYFETLYATQKNISSGLEKSKRSISKAPKFDYAKADVVGNTSSDAPPVSAPSGHEPGETETGIAESFDIMRSKTEALYSKSIEAENQFSKVVFPQLTTLRGDIDKHLKGLKGPGLKNKKDVEKARVATQKEIETLGQQVAAFGSAPDKTDAKLDPYVLKRNVLNSLSDQVLKENAQAEATISLQNNSQTLERHIVQVLQQAMYVVNETSKNFAGAQIDDFQSVTDSFQHILPDHEWQLFEKNNKDTLIPESAEKRTVDHLTFSNENHPSTAPLMSGLLQRKGTVMKQYHQGYFVLTPSKFLHEFKYQDPSTDSVPEFSLYLPDCTLGSPSSQESGKFKFVISGKDKLKSISTKHSFTFRASTYADMIQWHEALSRANGVKPMVDTGAANAISPVDSAETASPVDPRVAAASAVKSKESPMESPQSDNAGPMFGRNDSVKKAENTSKAGAENAISNAESSENNLNPGAKLDFNHAANNSAKAAATSVRNDAANAADDHPRAVTTADKTAENNGKDSMAAAAASAAKGALDKLAA